MRPNPARFGWLLAVAALLACGYAAAQAFAPVPPPEKPANLEQVKPKDNPPPQNNDAERFRRQIEAMMRLMQQQNPAIPADQIQRIQQQFEELLKRMDNNQLPNFPNLPIGPNLFARPNQPARLGIQVAQPSEALAQQLDLKGQGLVITEVDADSVAAKAGMQKNDILVSLNGKPVSDSPAEFKKLVDGLKTGDKLDAEVLRKGKKVAVKDITVPEPPKVQVRPFPNLQPLPNFQPFPNLPNLPNNFPPFPQFPNLPNIQGLPAIGQSISVARTNDGVTVTSKDGSVTIEVKGKVANNVTTVDAITIEDAAGKKSYDSADKVPADYKEKVKQLIDTASGKGNQFKFELFPNLPPLELRRFD